MGLSKMRRKGGGGGGVKGVHLCHPKRIISANIIIIITIIITLLMCQVK